MALRNDEATAESDKAIESLQVQVAGQITTAARLSDAVVKNFDRMREDAVHRIERTKF